MYHVYIVDSIPYSSSYLPLWHDRMLGLLRCPNSSHGAATIHQQAAAVFRDNKKTSPEVLLLYFPSINLWHCLTLAIRVARLSNCLSRGISTQLPGLLISHRLCAKQREPRDGGFFWIVSATKLRFCGTQFGISCNVGLLLYLTFFTIKFHHILCLEGHVRADLGHTL